MGKYKIFNSLHSYIFSKDKNKYTFQDFILDLRANKDSEAFHVYSKGKFNNIKWILMMHQVFNTEEDYNKNILKCPFGVSKILLKLNGRKK